MRPDLSFLDRLTLQATALGSLQSAAKLQSLVEAVEDLDMTLGWRLDAAVTVLAEHADLLVEIDQTLKSPSKTKAAERVKDAAELLKRQRWARALAVAEEAIQDDPNNPGGFIAAGWAALGLRDGKRARAMFAEAADASDGDQRAQALRQAARIAYALDGDPATALATLPKQWDDDALSDEEQRAVAYDHAIYLAEAGRLDEAEQMLGQACAEDERFCAVAMHDELLAQHAQLLRAVERLIAQLPHTLERESDDLRTFLDEIAGRLSDVWEETVALGGSTEATRVGFLDRLTAFMDNMPSSEDSQDTTVMAALAHLRSVADGAEALLDEVVLWERSIYRRH